MFERNWRHRFAPAAICLVLGALLAVQVRTQSEARRAGTAARVSEEMVAQLLDVSRERDRLREELRRLQKESALNSDREHLQAELLREWAAAGLVEVSGPGLLVSLSDRGGQTGSTRQVTAEDVMLILNELRAGGAEAISVGGVRVTPRLALARTTGEKSALTVNGVPVPGPVRVAAVGNPEVLSASLHLRGGVVHRLSPWLRVEVVKLSSLTVPAVSAPPGYTYARPAR